jgi:hypothetical protein
VLALPGRQLAFVGGRGVREVPRPARDLDLTAGPVGHGPHRLPVAGPRGLRELLDAADPPGRDLGLVQLGVQCLHVPERPDPLLHDAVQRLQVAQPQLRRQEARVSAQVRAPHRGQVERKGHAPHQAHRTREPLTAGSGEERPVGGAEDGPFGAELGVGKVGVHPLVDRQHHGRHGHVDVLAPPGALTLGQAGQDGDGGVQARVHVGVRERVAAQRAGPLEMIGRGGGDARLGLDRRRISHSRTERTVLPVPADRRVHHPGVAGRDRLVVEPEGGQGPGPEVLHDHVGGVAERKRDVAGARRVEVDAQVALARVLLRVVPGDLAVAGERLPGQVAAGRLELDDLSPQVEQRLGAVRAREHPGEIDDADPFERKRHPAHFPSNSAMPMPFSR